MKRILMTAAAGLMLFAASAQAQQPVTASDTYLYAGPGDDYPAVVQLGSGYPLQIYGCVGGYTYCDVSYQDYRGWIDGRDIWYPYQEQQVPVDLYGPQLGLPIISFVIGAYWGSHYYDRPFYSERPHWEHHAPPPRYWGRPRGDWDDDRRQRYEHFVQQRHDDRDFRDHDRDHRDDGDHRNDGPRNDDRHDRDQQQRDRQQQNDRDQHRQQDQRQQQDQDQRRQQDQQRQQQQSQQRDQQRQQQDQRQRQEQDQRRQQDQQRQQQQRAQQQDQQRQRQEQQQAQQRAQQQDQQRQQQAQRQEQQQAQQRQQQAQQQQRAQQQDQQRQQQTQQRQQQEQQRQQHQAPPQARDDHHADDRPHR